MTTRTRLEQMDAAANSAGNAAIKRVLAGIDAVKDELRQLMADHLPGCECDWCEANGEVDGNGQDVQQSFQHAERALCHLHDDLWMLEHRTFAEQLASYEEMKAKEAAKEADKPVVAE